MPVHEVCQTNLSLYFCGCLLILVDISDYGCRTNSSTYHVLVSQKLFRGDFNQTIHCFFCYLPHQGQMESNTDMTIAEGIYTFSDESIVHTLEESSQGTEPPVAGWVYTDSGLQGQKYQVYADGTWYNWFFRSAFTSHGHNCVFTRCVLLVLIFFVMADTEAHVVYQRCIL